MNEVPEPNPSPRSIERLRERALPYEAGEVGICAVRPLALVDLVLSAPQRIAANVEGERSLPALAGVLVLSATIFAIPYGLVHGLESWWRIVVLYLGSTLICLPSLHVFASYVGARVKAAQSSVLAMTIPAVAAAFTLGFAPILGFLRATMQEYGETVDWRSISTVLLWIALLAGVAQLWRCLLATERISARWAVFVVLAVWLGVFVHVLNRMADVLGL